MKASRRPYRMSTRAETAAATADRILDAAVEVFWAKPTDQISLDAIAQRAGVSVQTVIRRFGGKEGLLTAASERESAKVRSEREAPEGDLPAAVRVLVAHYESSGDRVLKMLAEEQRVPGLQPIIERGRAVHREWCGRVFAATLAACAESDRARRFAELVALCDVYMWKLLRRDARLTRAQTELALLEMLTPLMGDC